MTNFQNVTLKDVQIKNTNDFKAIINGKHEKTIVVNGQSIGCLKFIQNVLVLTGPSSGITVDCIKNKKALSCIIARLEEYRLEHHYDALCVGLFPGTLGAILTKDQWLELGFYEDERSNLLFRKP